MSGSGRSKSNSRVRADGSRGLTALLVRLHILILGLGLQHLHPFTAHAVPYSQQDAPRASLLKYVKSLPPLGRGMHRVAAVRCMHDFLAASGGTQEQASVLPPSLGGSPWEEPAPEPGSFQVPGYSWLPELFIPPSTNEQPEPEQEPAWRPDSPPPLGIVHFRQWYGSSAHADGEDEHDYVQEQEDPEHEPARRPDSPPPLRLGSTISSDRSSAHADGEDGQDYEQQEHQRPSYSTPGFLAQVAAGGSAVVRLQREMDYGSPVSSACRSTNTGGLSDSVWHGSGSKSDADTEPPIWAAQAPEDNTVGDKMRKTDLSREGKEHERSYHSAEEFFLLPWEDEQTARNEYRPEQHRDRSGRIESTPSAAPSSASSGSIGQGPPEPADAPAGGYAYGPASINQARSYAIGPYGVGSSTFAAGPRGRRTLSFKWKR